MQWIIYKYTHDYTLCREHYYYINYSTGSSHLFHVSGTFPYSELMKQDLTKADFTPFRVLHFRLSTHEPSLEPSQPVITGWEMEGAVVRKYIDLSTPCALPQVNDRSIGNTPTRGRRLKTERHSKRVM